MRSSPALLAHQDAHLQGKANAIFARVAGLLLDAIVSRPGQADAPAGHRRVARPSAQTCTVRADMPYVSRQSAEDATAGPAGADLASGGLIMHGVHRLTPSRPPAVAAIIIAAAGSATILGAYFFQYVVGLAPCPLCLDQRIAYYVVIPLAVLVAIAASARAPRQLVTAGLAIIALAMLFNYGLAVFHAGVEWKWWPGPLECSGPLGDLSAGGDLLSALNHVTVVRCDEAAWRFLGLSLAGYDALISLALALIAGWGMAATLRKPR
jgi:disulfide bond formation protein DsbB